jgi:hypothetical protein
MPLVSIFDRALPTSSSFKQSSNIHTDKVNVYLELQYLISYFCPFSFLLHFNLICRSKMSY